MNNYEFDKVINGTATLENLLDAINELCLCAKKILNNQHDYFLYDKEPFVMNMATKSLNLRNSIPKVKGINNDAVGHLTVPVLFLAIHFSYLSLKSFNKQIDNYFNDASIQKETYELVVKDHKQMKDNLIDFADSFNLIISHPMMIEDINHLRVYLGLSTVTIEEFKDTYFKDL